MQKAEVIMADANGPKLKAVSVLRQDSEVSSLSEFFNAPIKPTINKDLIYYEAVSDSEVIIEPSFVDIKAINKPFSVDCEAIIKPSSVDRKLSTDLDTSTD